MWLNKQRRDGDLDKGGLARKVTYCLCGRNRLLAALTACALLALSCGAGIFMARQWNLVRAQLSGSEILTRLVGGAETPKTAVQVLTDPDSPKLYFSYLEAMAPAITNLEISAKGQMDLFLALRQAALKSGVEMEAFRFQRPEKLLEVSCTGGDAEAFQAQLKESGIVSNLTLSLKLTGGEFTILCPIEAALSV